jgi:hypothetical protein
MMFDVFRSRLESHMSQDPDNTNENKQGDQQQQQGGQQQANQWSQMIGQALESVTGKNMSTTIDFRGLEIDILRAQRPDGRDLGSAKLNQWKSSVD